MSIEIKFDMVAHQLKQEDNVREPVYLSGLQRFMRKWGRWYQSWMNERYITREEMEPTRQYVR